MIINDNHPFITTSQDVKGIAAPLQKLGIHYFTYTKIYSTGERLYMTNHPQNLKEYIKEKSYLIGNVERKPETYKPQTVLWSTLPNQNVFDKHARPNNIDHGMFMINPNKYYNEYYGFATNKSNDRIINTYLTHLDFFENFINYFKEQAAVPIKLAESNKLILPFNEDTYHDNNEQPLHIDSSIFLSATNKTEKLSRRQNQCCSLLMLGKSSKEIAEILQLSVRTVEYYLANIKQKMKCRNKTELIKALLLAENK